ncbi:hypothetical protein C9196_14750 [Escherichia coli]|nr:hypothetical protein C9196_14750 [Escherichia coli]
MFSVSITLLNGSPFHSPVTRKCIYHLHKTKLAVASSDKRNPREGGDVKSVGVQYGYRKLLRDSHYSPGKTLSGKHTLLMLFHNT